MFLWLGHLDPTVLAQVRATVTGSILAPYYLRRPLRAPPSPRGSYQARLSDTAGGIPAGAPVSVDRRPRAAAVVHARTRDRGALPSSPPPCMAHPVWSH